MKKFHLIFIKDFSFVLSIFISSSEVAQGLIQICVNIQSISFLLILYILVYLDEYYLQSKNIFRQRSWFPCLILSWEALYNSAEPMCVHLHTTCECKTILFMPSLVLEPSNYTHKYVVKLKAFRNLKKSLA